MNLEIRSIVGRGNHRTERITLRCKDDTDLGSYTLLQTESRDGVVTTGVRRTMWFPNKPIQKGDLVVIYSRAGTQSEKVLTTGKTAHFLYWGCPMPLWKEGDAGAVLLFSPEWDARLAGEWDLAEED